MWSRFPENRLPELAEIYTARSLGCFVELIIFPARSMTFDLLSKVKYTKMVLVSCGHGFRKIARRNWPKFIPRALCCFLARSVTFDLLSKVKYTKMVLVSCGHSSRKNHSLELAEIYTTRSLGCFLGLISFSLRSVSFDLLSKVSGTKMVGQNTCMSIYPALIAIF